MAGVHEATARLFDYAVVSKNEVADRIYSMTITSEVAGALAPGQFVELEVPGDPSQILRLPLSYSVADADAGTVRLEFAVVGDGTRRLSRLRRGDSATLVGPCGNGWHIPEGDGRVLLIAGGIGIPPIVAAAGMLAEAGRPFDAIVGAQNSARVVMSDIDLLHEYAKGDQGFRVVVTTDDGSLGYHGFTTGAMVGLLSRRQYAAVLTCGPAAMMASVARIAKEHDIPAQASLERMMGCGFGACSCCNVEMTDGSMRSCCMDGPVFDAGEVAW